MDVNTITSYLVQLGFEVNGAQYSKFNATIANATNTIRKATTSWESMFKISAAGTVAALGTIAGGTIALLDSVSKADLGYKLFAMRMFMNEEAAKRLKIATDALGYSLEDIIWNPELRGRYEELMKHQARLSGNMSGDFPTTMKQLRDIRFEFTKMYVSGVWGMQVLSDTIARKFGVSLKDGQSWLEKINDIIVQKIPVWSERIATFLKDLQPIADKFGVTIEHAGKVMETFLQGWGKDSSFAEFVDWFTWEVGTVVNTALTLAETMMVIGKAVKGNVFNPVGGWKEIYSGMSRISTEAGARQEKLRPFSHEDRQNMPELTKNRTLNFTPIRNYSEYGGGQLGANDLFSKYFPASAIPTMKAIWQAESGSGKNLFNPAGGGYGALGDFQIRGKLHEKDLINAGIINNWQDLMDREKNFAAAGYLYSKYGTSPWNASKGSWGNQVSVGDIHVHVNGSNASADEIAKATKYELQRHTRQFTGSLG